MLVITVPFYNYLYKLVHNYIHHQVFCKWFYFSSYQNWQQTVNFPPEISGKARQREKEREEKRNRKERVSTNLGMVFNRNTGSSHSSENTEKQNTQGKCITRMQTCWLSSFLKLNYKHVSACILKRREIA